LPTLNIIIIKLLLPSKRVSGNLLFPNQTSARNSDDDALNS